MQKVWVLKTVWHGLVSESDPAVYSTEESAFDGFENEATSPDIGFRKRNEGERIYQYVAAFDEWSDSEECTYDKDDHEIHLWGEIPIQ